MTILVTCIGTGKGTWMHVSKLIKDQEWEQIYIITNKFGKENFKIEKVNKQLIEIYESWLNTKKFKVI